MFQISDSQKIDLNRSKSILIRKMILRFLRDKELIPVHDSDSEDVKTVARALSAMKYASLSHVTTLYVNDCGAAYRFLTAVAAVTPGNWRITGTERLLDRPLSPLVFALTDAGARIERRGQGWLIHGRRLRAEELTIDCAASSQFASALLLIGDAIGLKHLKIKPTNAPSMPYIIMTKQIVEDFRKGGELPDEADWSSAAFWYGYLAGTSDTRALFLKDLRCGSLQGDEIVREHFSRLGIISSEHPGGISIVSQPRRDIGEWELDLSGAPDLAPVLAATAVLYPFDLTLRGLQNLRHKESDRLAALCGMISQFAPAVVLGSHTLIVTGTLRKPATDLVHTLDTSHDHRMAMAAALLSLRYNVQISDCKCVSKSYPGFANYFKPAPFFQK